MATASEIGARLKNRCLRLGNALKNLVAQCIDGESIATALFGTWEGGAIGLVNDARIEESVTRAVVEALQQRPNAEGTDGLIVQRISHPQFRVAAVCSRPSTSQGRLVAIECLRQIVFATQIRVAEGDPELLDQLVDGMYCSQSWIRHEGMREVAAGVLDVRLFEESRSAPLFGTSRRFLYLLEGVLAAREESRSAVGTIAYAPESHRNLFGEKAFLATDGWSLRHNHKHVAKLLLGTPKGYELAVSEDAVLGILPSTNNRAFRASFAKSLCTVSFQDEELFFLTTAGFTSRHPFSVPTATMLRGWAGGKLGAAEAKKLRQLALRIHTQGHGGTLLVDDNEALRDFKCHSVQGLEIAAPESVAAFTEVDGAVLLDWTLTCRGFGGLLFESHHCLCQLDYSRGSRYNSSLNYSCHHPNALLFVFSADGGLTVLKGGAKLFPSVSRRPDILKKLNKLSRERTRTN